MPEYLAPGVFVEEVSFRAKSIEGVPTSTTGLRRPRAVRAGPLSRRPVDQRASPGHQLPRVRARLRQARPALASAGIGACPTSRTRPGRSSSTAASACTSRGCSRPTDGDATLGVASVSFADADADRVHRDLAGPLAREHGQRRRDHVHHPQPRCRRAHHDGSVPFANTAQEGSIVEVVPNPGPLPAIDDPLDPRQPAHRPGATPTGRRPSRRTTAPRRAPDVTDLLSIIELSVLGHRRRRSHRRLVAARGPTRSHLRFVGQDPGHGPPRGPGLGRLARLRLRHRSRGPTPSPCWSGWSAPAAAGTDGAPRPAATTGAAPGADDFNGQVADLDDVTRRRPASRRWARSTTSPSRRSPTRRDLDDPTSSGGRREHAHRALREAAATGSRSSTARRARR